MTTATAAPVKVKLPTIRSKEGLMKHLGLDKKEKLTSADHKRISETAHLVSKNLRKSNPQLASALYYLHYSHSGKAKNRPGAKAASKSRK